jgi:predicted transcriptional regulator
VSPAERRAFLDFVAELIRTLDASEFCQHVTAMNMGDMNAHESALAIDRMIKSGLLVVDRAGHHTILSITTKGRMLAADMRDLALKAVGK